MKTRVLIFTGIFLILGITFSIQEVDAVLFSDKFGSSGSADGQFDDPRGITIDSANKIIVADTFNQRIQVFDSAGNHTQTIGSFGAGEGFLDDPRGVTVDSNDRIIVLDTDNSRVQIFNSSGNFVKIFGWGVDTGANTFEICTLNCQEGIAGHAEGQFFDARGISVDSTDRIIIADSDNDRVQIFNSSGNFIKTFGWGVDTGANRFEICTINCQRGISGSASGQFDNVRGIAVDSANRLITVDSNNSRIQIFDSSGNHTQSFGSFGSAVGLFNLPFGIAIDSLDRIIVADTINQRIQIFNSTGNHIQSFGSFGSADGQFNNPRGISIDDADRIIVADSYNHRIQIFDYTNPCNQPLSGDWVITNTCTLSGNKTAMGNVIVQNNSVLVISNDVTLTINSGNNITIESGGGLSIKNGGDLQVIS